MYSIMTLSDRMKEYYENAYRISLTRRMPVIIRLDSRAGHTFTKGLHKPFDTVFTNTMQDTMKYLCENIQGCVIGYTQSDEITLCLVDYNTLETDAWFGYNLNKIVSLSASMATFAFNRYFARNAKRVLTKMALSAGVNKFEVDTYSGILAKCTEKGLMFDSRAFNLPKEEVCNCFLWRQLDASRNSIQAVGQAYFSCSELHGKNTGEIQDMLMTQKCVNWDSFATDVKRGSCCVKGDSDWTIDHDIPRFTGEGRDYIDKLIYVGE